MTANLKGTWRTATISHIHTRTKFVSFPLSASAECNEISTQMKHNEVFIEDDDDGAATLRDKACTTPMQIYI